MDQPKQEQARDSSEKGSLMQSLFSRGLDRLEFKGLQTYFLPKPAEGQKDAALDKSKAAAKKLRKAAKPVARETVGLNPEDEASDSEKERHTLRVLEGILREREEMLALHEQKVLALRDEYEAKLRQLESAGSADAADVGQHKGRAESEISRLEEENAFLGSLLLERKRELEKLRDEEMRLQMEMSRHTRDIMEHQQKFDSLHRAIAKLDDHFRQKQGQLDDFTYKAEMKKKEYHALASETAKLRRENGRLEKAITYDIEREIAVLAKRVDDHLRHSDYLRARKDYNRIRELYAQLSKEEKMKVYDKVARVSLALTA